MKRLCIVILTFTTLVCFGTNTKVTRVIDGDSFETETGEKVRLIGINAPEISDIFGQEAKQHLANLIEGKTIDLQPDNISKDRDRYSRLLRYAFFGNTDINKQMISDGFAFAYLKYHFSKEEEYRQAQLTATKNNNGIWKNGSKNGIIKQQDTKESFWKSLPLKVCFVISVFVILIFIGVFYYFKK